VRGAKTTVLPWPTGWVFGLWLCAGLAASCGEGSDPGAVCAELALSRAECTTVTGLRLGSGLAPSPGNAHADSASAAAFGFAFFFDARPSANVAVRCATCHAPESYFGDRAATPPGFDVRRNSPSLLNAARHRVFFWDGRADSLWAQPLFALENPREMDFTRLELAHLVVADFSAAYTAAFGPLPDLSDGERFFPRGRPGDAAWEQMPSADQAVVNGIAANVGKALEAYERKIVAGASALDRYLDGDKAALSATAKEGLVTFVQAGCGQCHGGPLLSDERFHNLGLVAAGQGGDGGRADAFSAGTETTFRLGGPFDDSVPEGEAPPRIPETKSTDLGAFRTPSLRNLGYSAPFGHDGRFATVADAVDFHLAGGGTTFIGERDPLLVRTPLPESSRQALLAFLAALDGDYPKLPWSNWPDR